MATIKLPKAYSQYGASMGRSSYHAHDKASVTARLRLTRVVLSGDYDSGGAYWGAGAPLYRVEGESADGDTIEFYFRAESRDDAKAKILGEFGYVNARFYR